MAKKTKAQMEAMLNDDEEDVEEMVKESKPLLPDWLGKKKDRLTGQYVVIKNGFIYIFKTDISVKPQEVQKDFQNNGEFKTKHRWPIYIQSVKPTQLGLGLQEEDEDMFKKVMRQNDGVGEEFIFEISDNLDKQLAAFIWDMKDPHGNIKMQRKGTGSKTKYHFSEA